MNSGEGFSPRMWEAINRFSPNSTNSEEELYDNYGSYEDVVDSMLTAQRRVKELEDENSRLLRHLAYLNGDSQSFFKQPDGTTSIAMKATNGTTVFYGKTVVSPAGDCE